MTHKKLPTNDGKTFLSSCCGLQNGFCVSVGSDEGTWHYECSKCHQPCDPARICTHVHYQDIAEGDLILRDWVFCPDCKQRIKRSEIFIACPEL